MCHDRSLGRARRQVKMGARNSLRRKRLPGTYATIYARRVRAATKYRKLPSRRLVRMTNRRQNSQNRLAVWLCLFAALCLYAPLALSAWPANSSCCEDGLCAMPEHHHRGAASSPDKGSDTSALCDHQSSGHSGGMTNCKMSCCDQQEHAPIAPVAYVVPAPASLASLAVAARAPLAATPNSFFVALDPLFPPPRA